jgi:D-threonate/D-erythronate kinase
MGFGSITDQESPCAGSGIPGGLTIIADDLTGACDAAVAFAGRAVTVRVYVEDVQERLDGVRAVTTESRDIAPGEAQEILTRLGAEMPCGTEIFKKIDSVFRGNSFVEIAESCRSFPARLAVLAPAYPAHGRRVRQGMLHLDRVSENGSMENYTIDLTGGLRDAGCLPQLIAASGDAEMLAQSMRQSLDAGSSLVLCDAWEQGDLEAVARAARMLQAPTLWIGSGGLAHALAQISEPVGGVEAESWLRGRTIFIVGSDHAATRQQVLYLREAAGVPVAACGDAMGCGRSSFVLEVPRGTSANEVRAALANVDPKEAACLFLTGGDTAMLICRALGIRSLRLLREFAPGVPLGVAEGGAFDGVAVMMKSGGFGERDLLWRVLQTFHEKEIVTG